MVSSGGCNNILLKLLTHTDKPSILVWTLNSFGFWMHFCHHFETRCPQYAPKYPFTHRWCHHANHKSQYILKMCTTWKYQTWIAGALFSFKSNTIEISRTFRECIIYDLFHHSQTFCSPFSGWVQWSEHFYTVVKIDRWIKYDLFQSCLCWSSFLKICLQSPANFSQYQKHKWTEWLKSEFGIHI